MWFAEQSLSMCLDKAKDLKDDRLGHCSLSLCPLPHTPTSCSSCSV